ncbi:MAG TPA: T9SS type A sorting domain-containing protein, partial [Pontibacter sp.]
LQQTSGYQQNPTAPSEELIVELHPNPTDKTIPVQVSASEPVTFVVYDAIGRKVYNSGSTRKQYNHIPLHNLRSGMYFLRAENQRGRYKTAKFIVQ